MKLIEPKWIADWREAYRTWPPQVCFTCANFEDNTCSMHKGTPPQDFAETVDACKDWEFDIPF